MKCPGCSRNSFESRKSISLHRARWCPAGPETDLEILDRWAPRRPDDPAECWIWTGAATRSGWTGNLYGRLTRGGVHYLAHRWAYELLEGPIPEGLHLDHLCRVSLCIRPTHLEPVTPEENDRRRQEARRLAVAEEPALAGSLPDPW